MLNIIPNKVGFNTQHLVKKNRKLMYGLSDMFTFEMKKLKNCVASKSSIFNILRMYL